MLNLCGNCLAGWPGEHVSRRTIIEVLERSRGEEAEEAEEAEKEEERRRGGEEVGQTKMIQTPHWRLGSMQTTSKQSNACDYQCINCCRVRL